MSGTHRIHWPDLESRRVCDTGRHSVCLAGSDIHVAAWICSARRILVIFANIDALALCPQKGRCRPVRIYIPATLSVLTGYSAFMATSPFSPPASPHGPQLALRDMLWVYTARHIHLHRLHGVSRCSLPRLGHTHPTQPLSHSEG